MTSNLGSQAIREITAQGGSKEEIEDAVDTILRGKFLPEFLNRIDETIVFQPLDRSQIGKIVEIQVAKLQKTLEKQGIDLALTPRAIQGIAELGYEPEFGARPLKRVIQQKLQNPLALELIKRPANPDATGKARRAITVDYDGADFSFDFADVAADKK